jgi:hypothetical protein
MRNPFHHTSFFFSFCFFFRYTHSHNDVEKKKKKDCLIDFLKKEKKIENLFHRDYLTSIVGPALPPAPGCGPLAPPGNPPGIPAPGIPPPGAPP